MDKKYYQKNDQMYNLNGKVALVTGASGEHGLGRAIATRLAKEGADVVVNDVVKDPYAQTNHALRSVHNLMHLPELHLSYLPELKLPNFGG